MKNKGIIFIVISLVLVIISGIIVFNLMQNKPINADNGEDFNSIVNGYNSELELYLSKESTFLGESYNQDNINVTSDKIKEIITTIKDSDKEKFEIQKGKLVYIKDKFSDQEIVWLKKVGIKEKN